MSFQDLEEANLLIQMQEGEDGNHEDSEIAEKW